jgi:hypothetical protein
MGEIFQKENDNNTCSRMQQEQFWIALEEIYSWV